MTLYLDGADRDRLDPILDACVAIYKEQLDEDGQVDFKDKAKAFMRTYGFLASILPYTNTAWEKLLIFLNFLHHTARDPIIDPAHCRRSCRRPRSSSSLAACGPAASFAKVMAEIAVVSGSPSLSITSRSITTDVSSRGLSRNGVKNYSIGSVCDLPGVTPGTASAAMKRPFFGAWASGTTATVMAKRYRL